MVSLAELSGPACTPARDPLALTRLPLAMPTGLGCSLWLLALAALAGSALAQEDKATVVRHQEGPARQG